MKKTNIVALVLGIIVAALLWQFYLKPKYDIKRGDEATLQALHEADIKALDEATDEIEGTVVFKSSDALPDDMEISEAEDKDDVLSGRSLDEEVFAFESTANRPLDPYEQAAEGDKRRTTSIILDSDDIIVQPKITSEQTKAPAELAVATGDTSDSSDPKNRVTLLLAPVRSLVIKTSVDYTKFKKDHKGPYPEVNFKKDMIIFLESEGRLASGFFEIVDVRQDKDSVSIDYRVNIIGSGDKRDVMPFAVVPVSLKKLVINQIK